MTRDIPSLLPATLASDALRSAVRFLQRGVRPDGSHEDGSDWEIASHQWGLFISWAYHRGVALPASLTSDSEGGREHDLLFDATNGRWLKFTKPFAAGFTMELTADPRFVRRPATPLQYLRRWRLANRLFGVDVRLIGLSCLGRTQRIVISQPHFAGKPPTWEEIDRALQRDHGLRRLPPELAPADDPERRVYYRGRLVVFDVCPANCARAESGRIVPFGAVPQLFDQMEIAARSR